MPYDNGCKIKETRLWHHRLGHASMNIISKLIIKDLVKDLPKLNVEKIEFMMHVNLKKKIERLLNLKI